MKVAILGYDVEGRASYEYFAAQGHDITILDQRTSIDIPPDVDSLLGPDYIYDLDRFDLIVRTAGLPPALIVQKNPAVTDKITTLIDEFMRICPTRNIIGVTGTKGKGTTSTLIAKMLEADGHNVYLGGNIGVPPMTFLDKLDRDSWVVLELSSFQLSDVRTSPKIGVCLMVVPEHLDWHADEEGYFHAKSNLFAHQTSADKAIYFADNETSRQIASTGEGRKIPYFSQPGAHVQNGAITINGETICKTTDLKLLGAHNWQNVCAAITAVWEAGIKNAEAMRAVLTTFTGLPHRLEMVRELNGVHYYDDSFGTAPETAIVAIQAFAQPEIVILGGRSKGVPFDELADVIAHTPNVKKVITIGETGPEIASELRQRGYQDIVTGATNMDEVVDQAYELADSGDVVLLSTGCASFDMFENYKDRGEQFTAAVRSLA